MATVGEHNTVRRMTRGFGGRGLSVLAATVALSASTAFAGIRYLPPSPIDGLEAADPTAGLGVTPAMDSPVSAPESSIFQRSLVAADLSKMRWERSFGGERSDLFNDVVVRRSDFAVISVGSSMSRSAGRRDAWVVAVDGDGDLLWERSFGGALDEEAFAVIDGDDGDIILVGSEASEARGGSAGFIRRLRADGSDWWTYRFDADTADKLTAVATLDNGDIIAAGSAGSSASVLLRLTPDGQAVWENTYTDLPHVINSVLPLPNGDLVLVGESTALFDSDGTVARTSSDGDVIWVKTVGGRGNDSFADATVLRNGDFLIVGEQETDTSIDGWLVRLGGSGELAWEKTVGGEGSDSFRGVVLRADQTLAAVGEQSVNDFAANNAWLVEFADDGSVSRAQTFGGEHREGFVAVSSRSDGGIVTVGFSQTWHDEPMNAYSATIGDPIQRVAMRTAGGAINPPVVFVPGEGKLLTDRSSVEVLGNVIHDKPVQQLFVDGRPTKVLQNGAFTARVAVPLGTTRLQVEAVDSEGAVGNAEIMVTRVEVGTIGVANLASLKDRIQFGNYHAVVIGNNQYKGDLAELQTAELDARAIAQTLESNYGFDVDLLVNAGHDEIVAALEEKSASLREDDNLLVYYAGHGYYDEDADLGYWLPVDADLDTKANWIRNSTITDAIKGMQAKHVMLVADSCFSGTLLRSVDVRRSSRFYEQMATRSARLVMTSGGIEPVMDGGGDGHSVFARNFLAKLDSGEEIIDGTSLFQAIREPVILSSEQVPQYSNIRFIDSDGGDFLFVRNGE